MMLTLRLFDRRQRAAQSQGRPHRLVRLAAFLTASSRAKRAKIWALSREISSPLLAQRSAAALSRQQGGVPSPVLRRDQRNAILWQPVAYPSNYKEKETAMFQKLMNTTDDLVVTLLRLVLGVVFFAHGAQKVLGWLGGIGLVLGFLGRVAAFGIFCNMVVAIVLVHRHFGLFANWAEPEGRGHRV